MNSPGAGSVPPEHSATRAGLLAVALLALELVAGMQAYLLNTVMPIIGTDFDAKDFYGVIVGSAQIAMFLTMPLGPYLLQRFRVDRLLLHLSWLTVAGSIVSALAPNIAVFVAGRVTSGLGAGALATVSLAAIVSVLPAGWRRAVLVGYNVMWVFASLAGPLYAAWITSVASWRWALVLYLPLLIAARIVAARQLKGSMQHGGDHERLTLGSAFVLAGGVALLSLVGLQALPAPAAIAVGVTGAAAVVTAARRLLPRGTLKGAVGRPAALATMGLLTGVYFGAQAIMSIVVQDFLGGTTGQAALVLAGSGMGWAIAGLAASRWPSRTARAYVRRAAVGGFLIGFGLLVIGGVLVVDSTSPSITLVLMGWTVSGVGMGLTYLDTLNKIVDVPQNVDGVSVAGAATATILIEAMATAVAATVGSAVVGRAVAQSGGTSAAAVLLAFAVVGAASVVWMARRIGRLADEQPLEQPRMKVMSLEIVHKRDPVAVRRILESLSDWFGDPGAIDNYVTAAGDLEFVSTVAVDSGNVLGISLTRRHFRESAELHLIAVDPTARGRGIGRALIDHVAADLRDDGCILLSVHTVGASFENEPYAHTRAFYRATGFHPLEEHNNLEWAGPTLILVRKL